MSERIRNAKEIEASYRRGFADGMTHALNVAKRQRELEAEQDVAIEDGLRTLHSQLAGTPRRRRRKANGSAPPIGVEERGEDAV